MKLITVLGARPQFIKAAVVSKAIGDTGSHCELIVHTGQHYDPNMSAVFFEEMGIPAPAVHLGIGSGSHGVQTGRMLEKIEDVLMAERPDIVLVYGDTNSTLAGALAATKLHIPVAHVEAGLRSFNRRMPEEVNRVLTDHMSTLLFAPTPAAVTNLVAEGIAHSNVHLTGDVMYDAALHYRSAADMAAGELGAVTGGADYILATIHRAENTDDPARLRNIMEALDTIAGETTVVLPLHPRTRRLLETHQIIPRRIRLIDPVGYIGMVALERNATLVVTDSGGVQKEAFFHRAPCVTLRTETEWVELVEMGWNRLVSPDSADEIVAGMKAALAGPRPEENALTASMYGGGMAAQRIATILTSF